MLQSLSGLQGPMCGKGWLQESESTDAPEFVAPDAASVLKKQKARPNDLAMLAGVL